MASGLKTSWKMVSLHCQQEPNRTKVFCIHGVKEADVSPQLALHCLLYLSKSPYIPALVAKADSFHMDWEILSLPVRGQTPTPLNQPPLPSTSCRCTHDLPAVHVQWNTPRIPGLLANRHPTDWGGLLSPWVENPLFPPYGKLKAWYIAVCSASIYNHL